MAAKYWCVDLSWPIREGFGDLPGHPATRLVPFHQHATHGRSNVGLTMSIHSGTHLDTPFHFFEDGATVDRLELDRLCCRGILIDLKGQVEAGQPIELEVLKQELSAADERNLQGLALLIRTGWGEEHYGGDSYYVNNPHFSVETAQWLAHSGLNLVGIDFPPDAIGQKMVVPAPSPVHKTLLGAGVCILENLTNLGQLPERSFELLCLPIKLEGQGGGPVRVLARAWRYSS